MSLLSGQVAVVTGAGRGLGRAVAEQLAKEGARVWVCSRTKTELGDTVRQIESAGGVVQARLADLSRETDCRAFIDEIVTRDGAVDVLVNNAGVLQLSPLETLENDSWSTHLAVNLTAPYLLTRGALPGIKKRGGSIINVSSRAGVRGFPNEVAYCATKFGLEGFTRALACEFEGTRASVNTMTPGLKIKPTSLTAEAFRALPEGQRLSWNDPAEIAPAFVLLARLRGEVSGQRFDAHHLSRAIASEGYGLTPSRILELAE